ISGRTASRWAAGNSADWSVRVETLHGIRKWRICAARARREWRIEAARKYIILGQKLVVEDPKPRSHRSLSILERIPGQTNSRRKVLQCRVGVPRVPMTMAESEMLRRLEIFPFTSV